jgi:hypothetical protein
MSDYADYDSDSTSPPAHAALVTPSDSTDLTDVTRAICFGTAGAIKVTTAGGETVVIPSGALVAGIQHPMRLKRVFSTGTTAASIVAWW